LQQFAKGLDAVKNNIENERSKNEEVSKHIESLSEEIKLRDNENSKLLAFSEVSKQTIEQLEQKSDILQQTVDAVMKENDKYVLLTDKQKLENEEKDKLII